MAALDRTFARAHTGRLTVEELLLRAALLARAGSDARPLARRLASVADPGGGRSCFEGGGNLQFMVDAPGPPELQVGVRLGERPDATAMCGLLNTPQKRAVEALLDTLPGEHDSFGAWLHWRPQQRSLFFDLRDPDPAAARRRLESLLDAGQRERLRQRRLPASAAREWAAKVAFAPDGSTRVYVYWLLHRFADIEALSESIQPGGWRQVIDTLGMLLRRPGKSGRWGLTTMLDDDPRLRLNNTAWLLVPEDHDKQRAVGRLMDRYGGPRRYAESLWSLCRNNAAEGWRVGRTCEVSVAPDRVATRLYFSAQTD